MTPHNLKNRFRAILQSPVPSIFIFIPLGSFGDIFEVALFLPADFSDLCEDKADLD